MDWERLKSTTQEERKSHLVNNLGWDARSLGNSDEEIPYEVMLLEKRKLSCQEEEHVKDLLPVTVSGSVRPVTGCSICEHSCDRCCPCSREATCLRCTKCLRHCACHP